MVSAVLSVNRPRRLESRLAENKNKHFLPACLSVISSDKYLLQNSFSCQQRTIWNEHANSVLAGWFGHRLITELVYAAVYRQSYSFHFVVCCSTGTPRRFCSMLGNCCCHRPSKFGSDNLTNETTHVLC
jgi:hypothetical protein